MLKKSEDVAQKEGGDDDKRFNQRLPFDGMAFPARIGKDYTTLRLKDLSRGGVAGLLDEPVAVGDCVYVEFDAKHIIEGEVRWVRRSMVGLRFSRPLDAIYVEKVYFKYGHTLRDEPDEPAIPSDAEIRKAEAEAKAAVEAEAAAAPPVQEGDQAAAAA